MGVGEKETGEGHGVGVLCTWTGEEKVSVEGVGGTVSPFWIFLCLPFVLYQSSKLPTVSIGTQP